MSRPSDCSSFRDCLADLVADPTAADDRTDRARSHAATCPSCQALLRAGRRHASLFGALPRPELPAELCSPSFLTRIHERVANQVAERFAEPLEQGMAPLAAPHGLDWQAAVEDPLESGRAVEFVRGLPPRRAPGWMWARIRLGLRSYRAAERRRTRIRRIVRAGLAAASVTVSILLYRAFTSEPPGRDLPAERPDIVFISTSEPLSDAYGGVFRRISDGPR